MKTNSQAGSSPPSLKQPGRRFNCCARAHAFMLVCGSTPRSSLLRLLPQQPANYFFHSIVLQRCNCSGEQQLQPPEFTGLNLHGVLEGSGWFRRDPQLRLANVFVWMHTHNKNTTHTLDTKISRTPTSDLNTHERLSHIQPLLLAHLEKL